MTCIVVVNGQAHHVEGAVDEPIGVIAHRLLAAERYDWPEFELRDGEGRRLPTWTLARDVVGTLYVGKPIGWGG